MLNPNHAKIPKSCPNWLESCNGETWDARGMKKIMGLRWNTYHIGRKTLERGKGSALLSLGGELGAATLRPSFKIKNLGRSMYVGLFVRRFV